MAEQQRRIEIENARGCFVFDFEDDAIVVTRNGVEDKGRWMDPAWLVLFDEVLALGADLDEHVLALRRETERAANLVRNWTEECDMRKEENATLQRRLILVGRRAGALQEQIARMQAKRAGDLVALINCPKCGSEYTTNVRARQDGVDGVLVVCIDCDEHVPWRALREEEKPKEKPDEPDPDGASGTPS